ncbi:hypothetical protein RvY_18057 [Ramazzottius varieornatus]|uniref:Uncharacterized protein n=1 Tax=Ramazzottius varieornatus TaxID=947166 RepID=A0A1D1W4D1_RAMVA|nr:hypothetical protein RvY_18057 [Ramazzottius varieornatus]
MIRYANDSKAPGYPAESRSQTHKVTESLSSRDTRPSKASDFRTLLPCMPEFGTSDFLLPDSKLIK